MSRAPTADPRFAEIESHRAYLVRYALAQLRDRQLAEEAVQEALLAALEGIDSFDGRSALRTWLTSILRFKVIDLQRRAVKERAPVGKKRIGLDARNGMLIQYITYDRRGELWKQVDAAFGQQKEGDFINKDRHGKPHWSWTNVHFHDIQSGRMDLFNHCKQISGGYKSQYEAPGGDEKAIVDKFCTQAAIARLGAV